MYCVQEWSKILTRVNMQVFCIYCVSLTLHLLIRYKMYPGVEFCWTLLTGTEEQSYQFFYLFIEVPLTENNHHSAHILLFTYGTFFQIHLDHFVEGVVFVQQLRTEKQTGNVAGAQNGCARTALSRKFK